MVVHMRQEFYVSDGKAEDIGSCLISWHAGGLWLSNLYVHPDHRGKGVATAILKAVISSHRDVSIYLRVYAYADSPLDDAMLTSLYSRYGFHKTDIPGIMVRDGKITALSYS